VFGSLCQCEDTLSVRKILTGCAANLA